MAYFLIKPSINVNSIPTYKTKPFSKQVHIFSKPVNSILTIYLLLSLDVKQNIVQHGKGRVG